jgi:hypothetical protein
MPLTIPTLDNRRYQDLLDEALARIPVHNPEWTNFNKSDPGVTIIEIFAFLTETWFYRGNLIPERNRRKFLSLLGVPLQPASSARGIVTFVNERLPPETVTLNDGLEVNAGQVPFRTDQGLDVLPIEAQAYLKQKQDPPSETLKAYYTQLYTSYLGQPPAADPLLYETIPLSTRASVGVDLGRETTDGSLWIALLQRASDKPAENSDLARTELQDRIRQQLFGKTLSLGIVPFIGESGRHLLPGGQTPVEDRGLLDFRVPVGGSLPETPSDRLPRYQSLDASSPGDVLAEPGIVQIRLPASGLTLWDNLQPLEAGVGDFPPALDDTNLNNRLITWLRISPRADLAKLVAAKVQIRLLWVGINATMVTQRGHVANELLPSGTGEPDQVVVLAKTPAIPESVQLTVIANGKSDTWKRIEDLTSAGPEVPTPDLRLPPGVTTPQSTPSAKVFSVNPESGELRFGDGLRGARAPFGATLRADYDYGAGIAGNVGPGSISAGPALPTDIKVSNPVRTWGGAQAETVSAGEKQIARYLQHRDRLVNAIDFETITLRTPGVDIGRVDVLPAFSPELPDNEPGDAVGAVTLMIVPGFDPDHPNAPEPDQPFLDTICAYLDSRRLVTTEVFLRGPTYKSIWISVGIDVLAGTSIATVREAVKKRLFDYLSPLPTSSEALLDNQSALLTTPEYATTQRGWPLRKPVVALELVAEANRVPGVRFVNGLQVAGETGGKEDQIDMTGLNLPRVVAISVAVGDPIPVEDLRGAVAPAGPAFVPVPVIPEEC